MLKFQKWLKQKNHMAHHDVKIISLWDLNRNWFFLSNIKNSSISNDKKRLRSGKTKKKIIMNRILSMLVKWNINVQIGNLQNFSRREQCQKWQFLKFKEKRFRRHTTAWTRSSLRTKNFNLLSSTPRKNNPADNSQLTTFSGTNRNKGGTTQVVRSDPRNMLRKTDIAHSHLGDHEILSNQFFQPTYDSCLSCKCRKFFEESSVINRLRRFSTLFAIQIPKVYKNHKPKLGSHLYLWC